MKSRSDFGFDPASRREQVDGRVSLLLHSRSSTGNRIHRRQPEKEREKNHSKRPLPARHFFQHSSGTSRTDFSKAARGTLTHLIPSVTVTAPAFVDGAVKAPAARLTAHSKANKTFTFSHEVLGLPPPPHSRLRAPSWLRVPMTRCWLSPLPRRKQRFLRLLTPRLLR